MVEVDHVLLLTTGWKLDIEVPATPSHLSLIKIKFKITHMTERSRQCCRTVHMHFSCWIDSTMSVEVIRYTLQFSKDTFFAILHHLHISFKFYKDRDLYVHTIIFLSDLPVNRTHASLDIT